MTHVTFMFVISNCCSVCVLVMVIVGFCVLAIVIVVLFVFL